MQELTPQEFTDTLRKGRAWLLTPDVGSGRLILDLRDDENDHQLFAGPSPAAFPEVSYKIFLDEVERIVREKGA